MSARSSVLAQALRGVLPLASRVATSPSAEVRTVTRAGVTTVTVVDGDRSPLTLTIDTRAPVPSAPSTQLAMFGEGGAPARHEKPGGNRVAPPPTEATEAHEAHEAPAAATAAAQAKRAPKPPKPAALPAVPEADALARKGLRTIVWQQTAASPWEVAWAEKDASELAPGEAWGLAAQGHRAREYARGGKCVRDSAGAGS